jgi:hypothetical protein
LMPSTNRERMPGGRGMAGRDVNGYRPDRFPTV